MIVCLLVLMQKDSLKAEMGEAGLLQAMLRPIQTLTSPQAVQV